MVNYRVDNLVASHLRLIGFPLIRKMQCLIVFIGLRIMVSGYINDG
jgi:hypothetical protein